MSLFTSTDFASACAGGTDWRDTSKNVLEKLDDIRTETDQFNFGFIYISDHLTDDATSILNLFKSVLKIDNWIGSVAMGVIGGNETLTDQPAISAMIGRFPEDSFCIFPDTDDNDTSSSADPISKMTVNDWLTKHQPILSVVHGDPMAEDDPQTTLKDLEASTDAFIVGGLTSSRGSNYQIANAIHENSISGAFFDDTVPVSTTLSQGCAPISTFHTITKADDNVILELNDRRAIDVLQDDLKVFTAKQLGKVEDDLIGDIENLSSSDTIPDAFKSLFQGQIHVALPFSQSDQKDYLVRNIMGIDGDEGSIAISEHISVGDHILFVERHEKSVAADLSAALVGLRKRVQTERGCFEPKGALYISCVARGFGQSKNTEESEISLINSIIGPVPITGFYAGGEINNARLYGYTGIITLFF